MASDTRRCPYCDNEIKAVAILCRYCGKDLTDDGSAPGKRNGTPDLLERMLIPVARPLSAIAAGYCGLFGVVPLCGLPFSIAAIVCGVIALLKIRANRTLSGSVRAWFGIIMGTLEILISILLIVMLIVDSAGRRR